MNEARNKNLIVDLEKTHVRVWSEDDTTTRTHPDHEKPHAAMERLGRSLPEIEKLRDTPRHEGFDVHGDAEALSRRLVLLPFGWNPRQQPSWYSVSFTSRPPTSTSSTPSSSSPTPRPCSKSCP